MINKKNVLLVTIVLLGFFTAALCIGVAGGYLFFLGQRKSRLAYSGPCDPQIPFTTFTDDEWGYSISYPETWFIERYDPGEKRTGSAGPEGLKPEETSYYMSSIATIKGNFNPQYSEDGEVIRIFLEREPIDPDFSLNYYLEQLREGGDLGEINGRLIELNQLQGSEVTMLSEKWNTRFVYLDATPYTYVLNFNIPASSQQEACLAITDRIQSRFMLTPDLR
jgi:hypothetical protein